MSTPTTTARRANKHLTLTLAGEGYSVPVQQVREIIRMQKITFVPRLPECVKGVINLRGRIIPIVDLRTQFGLRAETTDRTCIIVAALQAPAARGITMGLIVDSVEDVAAVAADEIEPPPVFAGGIAAEYLLGIAKFRDGVKMLLNLQRVLQLDVLETIATTTEAVAA